MSARYALYGFLWAIFLCPIRLSIFQGHWTWYLRRPEREGGSSSRSYTSDYFIPSFFPRLARRFVKAVSLHRCQWSNSFKFYLGEKNFPCHLLTTNTIERERGRVLIQGGWDTYLLVAWLSWEETS